MDRPSFAAAAWLLIAGSLCALPLAGCARGARRHERAAPPVEEDEPDIRVEVEPPPPEPERRSPLRVSLDGQEMEPVRGSPLWVVREPVSLDPVLRFSSDLSGFRRGFIVISPCNDRGQVTGAAPITIIDPGRSTLVPDADISLREPKGALISSVRDLQQVPFEAGGYYLMRLQADGASGSADVSVLFRIEGGQAALPAPFRAP